MKLYFFRFFFIVFFYSLGSFSQDTIMVQDTIRVQDTIKGIVLDIKPVNSLIIDHKKIYLLAKTPSKAPVIILSHWKNKNSIGFDLTQIAFMNWNPGGTSSVSGLLKGIFTRIRSDINSEWTNELSFRYGLNKQDGLEMRKTEDELRINSTFGYRKDTLSNWYYSGKFNFNTQFTNGYNYPNTKNAISKPFAPAYTFLGVGANYFDKIKNFEVYISPLTMKNTLVLDQNLADSGAFGMTKATYDLNGNLITSGEKSRTELGFLATNYYKKEVWKNIIMENRLSLYSDYINNFGNIDVEWRLKFDLVVNQYVKANIDIHLIYDDDVKTTELVNGQNVAAGAKVQLKQGIGVGLVYDF